MKKRNFRSFDDAISEVPSGKDRHLLRNFNFMNDGQPPAVGKLLDALGFSYSFEDLPDWQSGYLEPDGLCPKGWRIVINKNHSRLRQRFTALHEVAHYYLHRKDDDFLALPTDRAGFGKLYFDDEVVEEREANQWVEAIVFEQNALDAARKMIGNDPAKLSKLFGLSVEVVKIALKSR